MKNSVEDLKIDGSERSAGGKYNSVIINGEGNIDGNLDCTYLKVNGKCEVNGNIKADSVNINGSNTIKKNFNAIEFKINGSINVEKDLSAEKIVSRGNTSVGGDCNAEIFDIKGAFAIGGFLNAGELVLNLYGPSEALDIGGGKITVTKESKLNFLGLLSLVMPFGRNSALSTNSIEGDDIYLEYTKAKAVRGNNIILGPGCEIELVEYKDNFKQDDTSEVETQRKI